MPRGFHEYRLDRIKKQIALLEADVTFNQDPREELKQKLMDMKRNHDQFFIEQGIEPPKPNIMVEEIIEMIRDLLNRKRTFS
jgi:hypothetical protein